MKARFILVAVTLLVLSCAFIFWEREIPTYASCVENYGPPDLVAESIRFQKTPSGLRKAIIRGRVEPGRHPAVPELSVHLFATSEELKRSIANYFAERDQATNFLGGMYHPTRSWFGEKIVVVATDATGNLRSLTEQKIEVMTIQDGLTNRLEK